MAFDFLDGICAQFQGKACVLDNGYNYAVGTAFPRSDALIWSDTNHFNSFTQTEDLFTAERLGILSNAGVTDIYIEQLEDGQPFVDQLIEDRDIDKFVEAYDGISYSTRMSSEEAQYHLGNTARVILAAADNDPPIDVHFAQINNTDAQDTELDALSGQIFAKHDDYLIVVNQLATDIALHTTVTDEDIDLLYGLDIGLSFSGFNGVIYDYSQITEHFQDRVPADVLDASVEALGDLKIEQMRLETQHLTLNNQFRIDNDSILADRVAETRNPDGKVVIVHGSNHGGLRDNDLDEMLAQRGISSTRVNLVYDQADLDFVQTTPDPTEMSYFPQTDQFVVDSLDDNSEVMGFEGVEPTPTRIMP